MRTITRSLVILSLAVLGACDKVTGTAPEKALWQALDIQNYDFVYQVSCFCSVQGPNPAKLSVRGGFVTKVQPADTATFLGVIPPASTYPTIDSLFTILEKAQKNTPDGVKVDFDQTYHFPKRIFIDPVKNATDDEVTYTVQKFTPVIVPSG
jgi:hypothetical protein